MHNLNRNNKSIDDAFKEAKKGLHAEKASFLEAYETRYKTKCADYDAKAEAGNLKNLKPEWEKNDDSKSKFSLAFSLYSSSRPIITNHRKTLTEKNAKKKYTDEELLCPICSLKPVEETDHFAPRSIFPEYSCHLSNLIPLCHQCNHLKSENWLDEDGKQIFFNAFYDEVDSNSLFEVNVRFDAANKTMLVKVTLSPSLNPTHNPIHYRVKCTCDKLHLLKEYNSFLSSELRSLTTRIKSTYRVTGSKYESKQDFVNSQVNIWKDQLKSDGFNTPLLRLLYAHLIENKALHSDILTLFD